MASLDGLAELGQAVRAGPETPAKVVDNETLDTSCLGGIDHGDLVPNSGRSHNTHDGVLTRQRLGKVLHRVCGPDDGYTRREDGPRLKACDDGYVEASILC